jgi:hypothetical protein
VLIVRDNRSTSHLLLAIFLLVTATGVHGQGRGGGGRGAAQPPKSPKESATIDLTGYWTAVVTTDWRWRMTVPPKGDYQGIPINAEARKLADAWDPAKDEAAGEQCRSYGAPNIMRVPGRLRITWTDDRTLKLETDAGQQTRILAFGAPQGQGGDWQGVSQASWDAVSFGNGLFSRDVPSGALKVVTTKLKPGYLQKNGVPYSANAVLTEYFDVITDLSHQQVRNRRELQEATRRRGLESGAVHVAIASAFAKSRAQLERRFGLADFSRN